MKKCEAKVLGGNFMTFGPRQWEPCPNEATLEVTVKGQGKMLLCDPCLPRFREYATLPWTAKPLKKGVAPDGTRLHRKKHAA